jgi:type VI secretion system protein ImpC
VSETAVGLAPQERRAVLDAIAASLPADLPEAARRERRAWLDAVVDDVAEECTRLGKRPEVVLTDRIGEIDALLSAQVNEILHAPEFQRLEAAWRALHYLVVQSDTGALLKVRLLNASKADLVKDLETASEFDQSALFRKIYEEEYGMFGGEPFGTLIGDYEFGRHPRDIALLERFSGVVAAAHSPFLSSAGPELFGWESFAELNRPGEVARLFAGNEYAKWRAFRDSEDSRYVGLVLPRILLREPYLRQTEIVESFDFEEDVDGPDQRKYLWGNPAFALGARLADAFTRYSWCASIRGVDAGGLVEGLASHAFETDRGRIAVKGPVEIAVPDLREKELADLGFIPLVHCKGSDLAVFSSAQSCQRAKKYDTDAANANARLSCQLQYMFSTSRFAHYLKVMMRDKTGSVVTRDEIEALLNRWLMDYCLGNPDDAGLEAKARRPLRDASVAVRDVRGKPGVYEAVIHLQPHFQLDELSVSLRLVTELPAPAQR